MKYNENMINSEKHSNTSFNIKENHNINRLLKHFTQLSIKAILIIILIYVIKLFNLLENVKIYDLSLLSNKCIESNVKIMSSSPLN